jgi:hypothetical protein
MPEIAHPKTQTLDTYTMILYLLNMHLNAWTHMTLYFGLSCT